MKTCVVASPITSLQKVGRGISALGGIPLYSTWERPPIDCKYILVEYAEETQLAYDIPFLFRGKAVIYLTAEGVPQLSREIVDIINKNVVYAPHKYVARLLEEANIRVDGVVPHHVEWRFVQNYGHKFGYMGMNLWRKGLDLLFKMVKMTGVDNWLISTNYGEVPIPKDITIVKAQDEFEMYSKIGVYVLLSRAEGYGLAPREFSASTGRKSIVTDLPVFDDCDCYIKCPVREVRKVLYRGQIQEWHEVDVEKCVDMLRFEQADANCLRRLSINVYKPILEHVQDN